VTVIRDEDPGFVPGGKLYARSAEDHEMRPIISGTVNVTGSDTVISNSNLEFEFILATGEVLSGTYSGGFVW